MLPVLFVCPACRGQLTTVSDGLCCAICSRRYPLRLGFPDLRLGVAPDVDADDLESAEILAACESKLSFAELAAVHYTRRAAVSPRVQAAQMAHFEAEREQADRALEGLADAPGDGFLDLGCGMGRYLIAAGERFETLVGVDASLRQLVLARKHLAEAGVRASLAAADVERLPFADETFGAAAAADLIEHLADPPAAIAEAGRVLRPRGRFFAAAPNRFSLTPEPHVGVWGLGFLPRRRAEAYVHRRYGIDYRHIRPPSIGRFRRLLSLFPGETRVEAPAPGAGELATFPPLKRAAAWVYLGVRRTPGAATLLKLVAPYFQGWAQKRS